MIVPDRTQRNNSPNDLLSTESKHLYQAEARSPARGIVIVTGSNGRIGDAVMRRLVGRFEDVVGFDRKAPAPPPPGCVAIPVEITSNESVRDGLRVIREHHRSHIASVIHLAAYYDFFGKPSLSCGRISSSSCITCHSQKMAADKLVEYI